MEQRICYSVTTLMLSLLSRIAVQDKLRQEFSNIDSGFLFILLGLLGRLAGASESFGADVGMTIKTMNKFIKVSTIDIQDTCRGNEESWERGVGKQNKWEMEENR